MAKIEIFAPRVNANEDELLVNEIFVEIGEKIEVGDIVFSVETTKASVDVEAEVEGAITKILVKEGKMISVGAVMCIVETQAGANDTGDGDSEDAGAVEIKITAKAKLRASELGIDIGSVKPQDGRIGVAEVESAAPASKAALGTRISAQQAVIVGGGGHAATIGEVAIAAGWNIIGAVDANFPKGTKVLDGIEVIDSDDALETLFSSGVKTAFIGVGGATSSATRAAIYDRLVAVGFSLPPLVDPSAHFGSGVKLGAATYVLPNAMVGPRCTIGANVIVNSSCTVAHDCLIEDHVHLTPASVLAGNVTIGEGSVIGMGATVLFGCNIGRECLIYNGVSVLMDVKDNTEIALNQAPKSRI